MANPLRRLRSPALALLGAMLYGTAGYLVVERWSPLDAFYMTLITISTIGFGEVHRLTAAGRLFTTTLILGGVGIMLWALGIFTEILGTGQLVEYRRRRAAESRRRDIRNHFIVCGYGRMGKQVVRELERDGVPYVVIDHDPTVSSRLQEMDGHAHVEGDATSEDVLREAGIERARGLISAVDSDERAVYIVLAARALNPGLQILARAGQPESLRRLELAGADRAVSPYRLAGHLLVQMALRPNVVDVLDTLAGGGSGVEEIAVEPRSERVGQTLAEAGLLAAGGAHVLAVRRAGGDLHVSPPPSLRLEAGDLVVAHGSEDQLEALSSRLQ